MTRSFDYLIRSATASDEPFLWEMLYQAIYTPPDTTPLPPEIVNTPELARYVRGWGRPDDFGLIALEVNSQQLIGAVWVRMLKEDNKGYGYIDEYTPELSIAVRPGYRGKGVGGRLLTELVGRVQDRYRAISLSVSEDNPALRLYERKGFEIVSRDGGSIRMKMRCRG